MRKGDETRARLVNAAAELLERQGYAATGLNQILEVANAPRGSLYFHFPGGKEELAIEALAIASANFAEALRIAIASAKSAKKAIAAVADILAARLEASSFRLGCPLATTVLEMAPSSPAIAAACAQSYVDWAAIIEGALERFDAPKEHRREDASLILAAFEGALLLARAHGNRQPLDDLKRRLPIMLDATWAAERR